MNEIVKIIATALVGGVLAMTVRQYSRPFGLLTGLVTVTVIFAFAADVLGSVISGLDTLIRETGVNVSYFMSVVRVVGIAYITQFGAEILRDSGENAIAMKAELAGKICIMSLTLPIISDFLHACIDAVNLI